MFSKLFAAAVFCGVTASSSMALTLAPDPFTLQISGVDIPARSITGTAGVDATEGTPEGTTVEVRFVDVDTIDIAFFGGFDSDVVDLLMSMAGLNFSSPITGVTFNRAGSNIDEFIGDESTGQPPLDAFVEPELFFTATSFSAKFAFFDLRLLGDGPRLRYDIQVSTVPLPAALPFLFTGLAGLAGLQLRKKRKALV